MSADPHFRVAKRAAEGFGLPDEATLELVSHRENAVYRVSDPASGERFALRVHRPNYQTPESIRSELQWMEALRDAGVETPEVVRGVDGRAVQTLPAPELGGSRHCDLFRWIDGAPPDGSNVAATFALLGETNARIHRHAAGWKRPDGFVRQRWDAEGMLGSERLWGHFEDHTALAGEQLALFTRARKSVLARLERFGNGPDRFGLIHSDLMPENILVHEGVPRVIDFDDCGFGWRLYDLATLLAFDIAEPDFERRCEAWVEGYRGVEELPDSQLAELPTLIMARFLVGMGWLHTRRETEMAREYGVAIVALACEHAEKFLTTG